MRRAKVSDSEIRRAVDRARALSGYVPCACRDCFEIAIAGPNEDPALALCHACRDAGCDLTTECQAAGAYDVSNA